MTASFDFHPGAPQSALAPASVLQDRYRIVRQLGRGGMGAVYEAVDERLGITVALKETLSAEVSMRRQFEREARLLAGMQHPALPRVSDHFVEGDRAFLVMQFIGGVDLARVISQQPGPFPRDQVIAWADQLLDALIYLHSRDRQVIHRDIKPHNLRVTASGQIALLDFGLAKAQASSDSSITSSQAFFGYTRHYAPLEQIQDQHTDPRSDIYALGATLYHLLTGIKPPDAMVRASSLVNAGPDPLKSADEIHAAVDSQIAAILNKAMAQRPEDRYRDAGEFREALRRMGRTKSASDVGGAITDESHARVIGEKIHISSAPSLSIPTSARVVANWSVDKPGRQPRAWPSAWKSRRAPESVVSPALVTSARRFRAAGASAILVVVVVLTGGVVYRSTRGVPAVAAVANVSTFETKVSTANLPPSVVAQRPGRSRVDNMLITNTKPPTVAAPVEERVHESKNVVMLPKAVVEKTRSPLKPASRQVEKQRTVVAKAQVTTKRTEEPVRATQRREPRRVGVPNIRFPNQDVLARSAAPAPDAPIPAFGSLRSAPQRSSNAAPKFYRAADGTQIVKFPDGSTQFIPPGHRSAQAAYASRPK